MKKLFATLLAGLMAFSMVACAGGSADTTTAGGADGNTGATTAATTTKRVITTPAPAEPEDPNAPEDWTLLPLESDWHYQIFNCPTLYNSADEGTAYDPDLDEMAAWIAKYGDDWYKNEEALAEMAAWPIQTAPMGDRYLALGDGNSPIGWSGDAHGLICYTTFELTEEQMGWVKYSELYDIYMDVWYDNTFYIWINGTLVYSHDGEGAPQANGGADWNDALEPKDFADDIDIREVLKEGENTIVVSLKDGWGGREFILGIECLY